MSFYIDAYPIYVLYEEDRINVHHDKLGKFAHASGGGLHPKQYRAMVPTGVYSEEHKEKLLKTLESTKEGKVLADTMIHFQEHEYVKPFRKDIEGVLSGESLPSGRHERAQVFLDAVKHAPPDLAPPKVYRGMTLAEPPPVKGMYEPGTTHNFAVASFSSSREVSESYQRMTADRGNISVMVELSGDKKLLPIENLSKNEQLFGEHEWVGSGKFKVEAVSQVGTDVTIHMVQEGTLG